MAAELLTINYQVVKMASSFSSCKKLNRFSSRKLVKPVQLPLFMEGSQIKKVNSHKHLGIFLVMAVQGINVTYRPYQRRSLGTDKCYEKTKM